MSPNKLRSAIRTEMGSPWIIELTLGAFHNPPFPSNYRRRISTLVRGVKSYKSRLWLT